MRSLKYLRTLLLVAFGLLLAQSATATHIRAGEITARRINQQKLEYEITLWGYADTDSEVIFGSNGLIDFGDGTTLQLANSFSGDPNSPTNIPRVRINEDTWLYKFTVKHTFPSARTYRVTFREFYRNEGILNMDNSVNMPFYIETVIVIDPFLGVNNTPQLLVPPVDKAAVGKIYIHNPGAYDIDGDSLSYRLVVVRQDKNTPVANYRFPQNTFPPGDPRNGTNLINDGPSILTLDPITGDLVWNTPGTKGEYNVAFYVEEWRKINGRYYLLGHVTRDMQILVEDTDNNPPEIEVTEKICVIAGEKISEKIKVTDLDGDKVDFTFFGGPFTLGAEIRKNGNVLTLPDSARQNTPLNVDFIWQTECSDIRSQPYQVTLRATDVRGNNGVELTDIKTVLIQVVAPPPVVESVTAIDSRSISVDFDRSSYSCQQRASAVQVWRREGSVEIEIDTCKTGMPAGTGYELVDVRSLSAFPFVDNKGLKPGATYCYRMVTVFPAPAGGESLVSEEKCVTLPAKMPIITNVSILKTEENGGEILVQWVPGPDFAGEVPNPRYDLYRSQGFEGGPYKLVEQNIISKDPDTGKFKYIDKDGSLNTKDVVYNYYVLLRDGDTGAKFDSSSTASTVRLTPIPATTSITLQWEAEVPWTNRVEPVGSEQFLHDVYRNRVGGINDSLNFVRIAQVNVLEGGFTYVDDGTDAGTGPLLEDVEYCYYVITSGSYNNPALSNLDPLLNNSQKICSYTRDEIPPCPPLTFELANMESCEEILRNKDCDDNQFENTIVWTADLGEADCFKDLSQWLVYYSPDGKDYQLLNGTPENFSQGTNGKWQLVHKLPEGTMAGFYYIQAVDRSGNLSEPSPIIMRDNCPNYWLPNVITRNGDGVNDELRPPRQKDFNAGGEVSPEAFKLRCPRFVESVVFKVYNRWGKQVYEYSSATAAEKDIYINWDGRTSSGEPLTNGTYYYIVDVTYNVLDPAKRQQSIKGWVYVFDGTVKPSDTQ